MTIPAAFWWEEDEENSEARVNAEAVEVLQLYAFFFLSFSAVIIIIAMSDAHLRTELKLRMAPRYNFS